MRSALATAAVASAVAALGGSAHALRLPAAPRCPIFPATNPWNQRVDRLPVASDSATLIDSIGLDAPVHADFGSGRWNGGPIGLPFDVVGKKTPRSRVRFRYAAESDEVRYPIPRTVHVEGGRNAPGDRHALLLDRDACKLYELYDLQGGPGHWRAGSGAVWNLRSNHLRPAGWTSADAAGRRSSPGSRAGTRCAGASSTTRSASPHRARAAPTSTRRGTRQDPPTIRPCRRWACGCG